MHILVCPPGIHRYVLPLPDIVFAHNVVLCPEQIVSVPVMVTVGLGATSTVNEVVSQHWLGLVQHPMTIYVVVIDGHTTMEEVVCPVAH